MERYVDFIGQTLIQSAKQSKMCIRDSLNLNMKIGDVEYQGDGNKAIFYYIADERVDFRQLIKVLAEDVYKRQVYGCPSAYCRAGGWAAGSDG